MFPTSLQSENSQWGYLKMLLLSKTIIKRIPATHRNTSKLYVYKYHMGLPWWLSGKNPPANNARDAGSVPGLGRYPGGGNDKPLQYSCLESPWTEDSGGLASMGLQKSKTQLSN